MPNILCVSVAALYGDGLNALVCRRHGVMLVRDTPVAIDIAQSICQPEEEPALLRRAAERAGAVPHDSND